MHDRPKGGWNYKLTNPSPSCSPEHAIEYLSFGPSSVVGLYWIQPECSWTPPSADGLVVSGEQLEPRRAAHNQAALRPAPHWIVDHTEPDLVSVKSAVHSEGAVTSRTLTFLVAGVTQSQCSFSETTRWPPGDHHLQGPVEVWISSSRPLFCPPYTPTCRWKRCPSTTCWTCWSSPPA